MGKDLKKKESFMVTVGASKRKTHQLSDETIDTNDDYNIFINFEILESFFDLVVCTECAEILQLTNDLGRTIGFLAMN